MTQYKSIMNAFIGDDQESDISITSLSVQMFTVPSVAENLIEEFDAFTVMASFFLEQLEEQKIVGGKNKLKKEFFIIRQIKTFDSRVVIGS